MKNSNLIIQFETWKSFKEDATKALKNRKQSITPKNTLVFNSVADYQTFMTEQKLAILAAVINKKPPSIYKLAQLVERDFANVQRDCVALVGMGFMILEDTKDAKKSKKPKLSFSYTKIVVQMPSVSYTHDLDEAA